jgi:hypothetical protein
LFIVRQPKVVFVEYSPKQKLTKSLTRRHDFTQFNTSCNRDGTQTQNDLQNDERSLM